MKLTRASFVRFVYFVALMTAFSFYQATFASDITENQSGHVLNTRLSENHLSIETKTSQPGFDFRQVVTDANSGVPSRDEGHGELLWTQVDENGITDKVAISGDGEWVAVGYTLNDERLELRNALNGELVFQFPVESGASWTDINEDGSVICYSALDSIWMFRPDEEGIPFFRYGLDGYSPGPLAISRNGDFVISTASDPDRVANRIIRLEPGADEPAWVVEVDALEGYGWYGVSLAEDGGIVAVNGKYHLYILDVETGEIYWDEPTYNAESSVVLSADAGVLVVGSLSGRMRVFAASNDHTYFELWHYSFSGASSSWVSSVAVSPDGEFVTAGTLDFYEANNGGRIAMFDTYGFGDPIWISESLGDEISKMKFNSDGTVFVAGSWGDVANETPDVLVYETHSPEPIFRLVTPGSISNVDISDDGSRIVAGGKAVHNRVFGRGGRVVAADLELLGGVVTGVVEDPEGERIAGATILIEGNPYRAITDSEGFYSLRVELDENQERHNVLASAPGYMIGSYDNIVVTEGEITENIDFELETSNAAPQGINATQGVRNTIRISWDAYNDQALIQANSIKSELNVVRMAVSGEVVSEPSPTPWELHTPMQAPSRDNADDAEAINIYRSPVPGGPYRLIGTVDGDATAFTDNYRLFPGSSYYYVVSADFGNGESPFSEEVTGWVDDSFLVWDADLVSMENTPDIDGIVNDDEWEDAEMRDISDVFGYDALDTAGTVQAYIGFNDETDMLYFAFKYFSMDELQPIIGAGIYVDDDGDGEWDYDRSGSEGNYWAYSRDDEPWLAYRSLSGTPYNGTQYFEFPDPAVAFSTQRGYVEFETAIQLGFRDLQDIALYHPDYTIGLGLFAMYRDADDVTVFNGWWPQDIMSIVSNPYQFARVHIPADLIVPPDKPEGLNITLENENLNVSWMDPFLGIDGAELDDFDGIIVNRNGEELDYVARGDEEYLDESVEHSGWYEYRVAGYVMDDEGVFPGPFTDPVGAYAGGEPHVELLSQDDGSVDTWYIVDAQGLDNRFAVGYSLDDFRDTVAVYWIEFIPRSTTPINVYITENDNGVPGRMLSDRFMVTPTTTEEPCRFHFPGLTQPSIIIDPDTFNDIWVVLEYLDETPSAPAVGVDISSQNAIYNKYYRMETGWQDFTWGRLMFRLGVGQAPSGITDPVDPVPTEFWVGNGYPNPFNSSTVIPIKLPFAAEVSLKIFGLDGRAYATHNYGKYQPGNYSLPIEAIDIPAGLYFFQINAGGRKVTLKSVIVK